MRTNHTSQRSLRNQQGIALVTTLLLLMLLTAMSLTLVLSVSSDMLLTGYYRNYRGSFYAADSGLNVARQSIINSLTNSIPNGFDTTKAPLGATPTSTASTAGYAGTGSYGTYTSINTAYSWPEKVQITKSTVTPGTCTVSGGLTVNGVAPTCANPTQNAASPITSYNYTFNYQLEAVGQSQGSETMTLDDNGTITLVANTGLGNTTTSFAAFGMFIDQYSLCGGGDLVPGTITGPVWTNGSWNFSNSGTYTFTDKVNQVGAKAGFDSGGSCTGATTVPSGFNVNFTKGINFSANNGAALALPQNSYSQQQAVVDGIGASQPTQTGMAQVLKNAAGIAYPATGQAPSTGVYLPYSIDATSGKKTFIGGGILVQGDAKVTLAPGSTSTAEVYTIVQGSGTTTVTIDPAAGSAGTTTITTTGAATGNGTQTISGVPQQFSPNGVPMGNDTMLYVNGSITSLSGPGQGLPAINNGVALTVTGSKDITVTGDILYAKEPVQTTGTVATGLDSLIPGNDSGQVLGIFTANGNVNLANTQSNKNLEIDASIATISQNGSGGIVNTGNAINTLTIVGGRIQNTIQNINSTTRNVLFDQRFAGGAFAPPWFPSTAINNTGNANTSVVASVQRSQWLNKAQYQ